MLGEQRRELRPLIYSRRAACDEEGVPTCQDRAFQLLELERSQVVFGARPVLPFSKPERRDEHSLHPRLVLASVSDMQELLRFRRRAGGHVVTEILVANACA